MARFVSGWLKLYRSAIDGDIGRSGVQLAVWVTLLSWATRYESKIRWKGEQRVIPPGSVLTGIREIAGRLGFSKDSVSRALRALASRDSIRIETATRGTLVTICNWADYQETESVPATQARHSRDTAATPAGRQPDLIGELRIKNKTYNDAFLKLWGLHPKGGKAEAYTKWQKIPVVERKDFEKAVINYLAEKDADKTEIRYRKDMVRFIESGRGRDKVEPWREYVDRRTSSPTPSQAAAIVAHVQQRDQLDADSEAHL